MSTPTDRRPAIRQALLIHGIVQGVGFRPHVARLAADLGLAGDCRNDSTAVIIEIEGEPERVEAFIRRIVDDAPRSPGSRRSPPPAPNRVACRVRHHRKHSRHRSADHGAAGCRDLRRMPAGDVRSRRSQVSSPVHLVHRLRSASDHHARSPVRPAHHHDGRLSDVSGCAAEYADPAGRRFHAQPIACHRCGPTLSVVTPDGRTVASGAESSIARIRALIEAGEVVAVKGLGGYHLVCDAGSDAAVGELRRRKQRPISRSPSWSAISRPRRNWSNCPSRPPRF